MKKARQAAFSIRGGGVGDFTTYYVICHRLKKNVFVFFKLTPVQMILCSVPWVEIRSSDAISLSRDSVLHSSKTKQN
jgi:hypothetical protein